MADLRSIAQGATNPQTGEYLSAEQRKLLFRKGRMGSKVDPSAFLGKPGAIVKRVEPPKTTEGPGGALVKQEDGIGGKEVEDEFQSIKYTFVKVLKTKKEKERLRNKYYDLLGKQKSKPTEPPDDGGGPDLGLKKKAERKTVGFFGGLLGALGDIIAFGVLDWIGNPKNRATVEMFVKGFQAVFNFFNWYITGLVDNILGGFAMFVGGDSLLERIGGFFKLVIGIFGLRYLSLKGPLRLAKDLKFVLKNIGKFKNFFKSLIKLDGKGMKAALEAGAKGLVKIFRKNLGRVINRFLIKLFGKAFAKGAKAFGKFAIKKALGLIGKFPIIGPILQFGFNLAMGEPLGKAAFKTLGSIFLGGIGTALGGPVGWAIGGLVGDWAGGVLYDAFFGGKEKKDSEETPEMSVGGIASGPKTGYLVMLHGTEVVIPINRIGEILGSPFAALGSGIIGGIFAVINSLGPVSNFVRPIAVSVLGPQLRMFGMETYTMQTEVGNMQGNPDVIARKIEERKQKQSSEDVFGKDFLKNIGMMLMVAGGSIFGGGAAKAGTLDQAPGYLDSTGMNADQESLGRPTPGNTSSAAGQWKPLLELIAAYESVGGSYDSIYPSRTKPGLSSMTIAEADAWQASTASSRGSAAAGRYQFMNIKKQAADAGIGPNELFSPENQDKMAISLLTKKRKITLDMVKNNPDEAMIRLGMEWAAMPMPKRMQGHRRMVNAGQSYYAGDGKNAAHVSVAKVKAVLAKIAGGGQQAPQQQMSTPQVQPLTPQVPQTMGLTVPQPQQLNFTGPKRQTSGIFDMSSESSIQKKIQSRQASTIPSSIFSYNTTQLNSRMNINNMSLNSTSISSTQVLNRL